MSEVKREWTVEAIVARMKSEIEADIEAGLLPVTVKSFSELHDHTDANEYGGLCDDDSPFDASSDADAATINAAQDAVDKWLRERVVETKTNEFGDIVVVVGTFGAYEAQAYQAKDETAHFVGWGARVMKGNEMVYDTVALYGKTETVETARFEAQLYDLMDRPKGSAYTPDEEAFLEAYRRSTEGA